VTRDQLIAARYHAAVALILASDIHRAHVAAGLVTSGRRRTAVATATAAYDAATRALLAPVRRIPVHARKPATRAA
jgi:hypothetical protein